MAPTNPQSLLTATLLLLAGSVSARTNIAGCVSTEVGTPYSTLLWYVPDTGEICEFIDCGGGRAPPKSTVPGCPLYEGTETVTPQFWTGFTSAGGATTSAGVVVVETTATTAAATAVVTNGGSEGVVFSSTAGPVSTGVTVSVSGTGTGAEGPAVTTMATVTAAGTTGAAGNAGGSAEGSSSVSSSTVSSAGAVATGAGMRVLGAVAGVAAAGLVFA